MPDQLGANFTAKRPRELFEDRLFVVPDYQRGYSWERQQWLEFVEDVDLLPPGKDHYTGTVVLQASVSAATVYDVKLKPFNVFEVVDGQQRLTTIVLLMDSIRRRLLAMDFQDYALGISETFLFTTDRNKQLLPKLKLGSDSQEFFLSHILQDKPWLEGSRVRSHRNLEEGKRFFGEFLDQKRALHGDNFLDWLLDFRHKVSEQLVLTIYPVGRESDAGVIFEVMNNRGKPITELEKVKNYLLYLASKLNLPEDHQLGRQVNEAWAYLFQRLMSSGLATPEGEDQLLRVHWLMAFDPVERNWKGSKSLKGLYNLKDYDGRHDELLANLSTYVVTLRQACTGFCDVVHPRHPDAFAEYKSDPKAAAELVSEAERLPRLRTLAPFLPLLVAVRLRFPGDAATYRAVLSRCERFAFRVYRLLQRRSQTGRSTLFLRGSQVYGGALTAEDLLGHLDGLTLYYSKKSDFERAWELDEDTNWYAWSGLRYFLYEYESFLCQKKSRGVKASWGEIEKATLDHTIEHVLPQTPKAEYWTQRFDRAAVALYTNDLGNLSLTLDNSSYGNKPFPEKKGHVGAVGRCYAEGDLLMERELATYEEWTPREVERRREGLVSWAIERWSVEGGQQAPETPVLLDEEESDVGELEEPAI